MMDSQSSITICLIWSTVNTALPGSDSQCTCHWCHKETEKQNLFDWLYRLLVFNNLGGVRMQSATHTHTRTRAWILTSQPKGTRCTLAIGPACTWFKST